jgi:F-type H+-transporting ATPase subunit epsilon
MKPFFVDIVSPENVEYEGQVTSLVLHSAEGYLGILADHAPLMAQLTPGKIFAREVEGREISFQARSSGFVEVFENKVHVLLDEPFWAPEKSA